MVKNRALKIDCLIARNASCSATDKVDCLGSPRVAGDAETVQGLGSGLGTPLGL